MTKLYKATTIPLHVTDVARLNEVSATLDISYSKLIGCLLALPDEEIKAIIDRNVTAINERRKEVRLARKEVRHAVAALPQESLEALKGLSPEKIAELAKQVQEAK